MDDPLNDLAVVVISMVCGFALGAALFDRLLVEFRMVMEMIP
jgi:hypothetical protein